VKPGLRRAPSLLLGALGCGDPAPASFVTEHLEVFPSDSEVICRGTLDLLEAQVVRVAGILRVELPPGRIRVDFGESAIEEYCGTDYGGCATGLYDDTRVVADDSSAYHELVHGVRWANGLRGTRFFEEGLANVLSGFHPFGIVYYGDAQEFPRSPAMLATAAWDEVTHDDYGLAGHFMSWMFTTFGEDVVAEFFNDAASMSAETVDAAFAEHFGLSLAEAEAVWRATSEDEYVWGARCDPSAALAWSGSVLEFNTRLACDEPRTLGPGYGVTLSNVSNCFYLDQSGPLRVEMIADAGKTTIQNQGCHSAGLTADYFQPKVIAAGESLEFPFAGCTWEILLATDLKTPTDVFVRLTRL
jgi:hypothetical protein